MRAKQTVGSDVSGEMANRDIKHHNHSHIKTGHITGSHNIIGHQGAIHLQMAASPVIKVVIQPGAQHISEAHKFELRELVNEIIRLEATIKKSPKRHAAVWSALTAKLKVTSYHLIPADAFERAKAYLQTWCARLRASKNAPTKDPDWRNSRYSFIHAAAAEIGRNEDIPKLLAERYSGRSLKDLSSLELENVYRIIASWKKQARQNGA
ncbi:MAG: transcriptional regulator [Burkholderiaceae bacterium]|nr:transcriptional regulator [Burkholderiaceae bacterium]